MPIPAGRKMQKIIAMFTFVLSITASGTVSAGDIFKWTDEEGNVHFSDKPAGESDVERLDIQSRPTNPARVQAEVQAQIDAHAQGAEEEASEPQGPTSEELLAAAQQREERCQKYTQRQVEFTNNRRIYRLDENGERVYYDEAEMAVARAELDGLVEKYCE
jgi:hypothetical protein